MLKINKNNKARSLLLIIVSNPHNAEALQEQCSLIGVAFACVAQIINLGLHNVRAIMIQ